MAKPIVQRELLKMSPLSNRPWGRSSADFCGTPLSGNYL